MQRTIYFCVNECSPACLYLPLAVSGAAEASSGNRVKVAVTCRVGAGGKNGSYFLELHHHPRQVML